MYATSNDGHSYLPSLLRPGGWALDVGCRGFEFSQLMAEHGLKVIAIDADPGAGETADPRISVQHVALIGARADGAPKEVRLFQWGEGCTYNIVCGDPESALNVPSKTLPELMQELGIRFFE